MAESSSRLSEIVQAIVADRRLVVAPSSPRLRPPDQDISQLVFVGNWQDPCPRRLLFDPHLEPIDIVTWQVIRVYADPSKAVTFPSYSHLMRGVRVSRATIARALAVLRLTRWLPLCAALRDADGRFAGHVYALSDEPVPLGETLAIDEGYVAFVEQAQRHRSSHVRQLAAEMLEALRGHVRSPVPASLESVRLADHLAGRLVDMVQLADSRVQNLNAVRVQNLNAVRSSSNHQETTTTTTGESHGSIDRGAQSITLVFPDSLSLTASQRRAVLHRLEQIPEAMRQDVLDEAAGRIRSKRATSDPVRCQFDYVARLCVLARDNQFVLTDAGGRIRREREQGAAAREQLKRARQHTESKRREEIKKHQERTQ